MQNPGNFAVLKDQTNNNLQRKGYVYTKEKHYRHVPTALTVLSVPK